MNSSDNYSSETLNNIIIYIHRYITPILYIVSNIGNILSMIVFLKKSWRKNVCVFYFLMCLLVNLAYTNSSMLGSIFTFGFDIHVQNSNVIVCKLLYYISYLFGALLPNILIFASIDRLLISSRNLDTRLYSSKRLAYFSLSTSTVFWMIFYTHTLIKIDIYEIYPSVLICYYDTSGFYFEFISYSSLIVAVLMSVLLIILSILSFKNVHQIRSMSHEQRQRQQFHSMHKKDFQLLRCLYIHDIIFTSLNSFAALFYTYQAAAKYQARTVLHQSIDNLLNGLGIFSYQILYCISFFIFISVSKAFRQEIKRMLYKIYSKELISIREDLPQKDNNDAISTIQI